MLFGRVRSYLRRNGTAVRSHMRKKHTVSVEEKRKAEDMLSAVNQLSLGELPTIPKQINDDEWDRNKEKLSRSPSVSFAGRGGKDIKIDEEKTGISLEDLRNVTASWPPTAAALPEEKMRYSEVNSFGNVHSESVVLEDGSAIVEVAWSPASHRGAQSDPRTGKTTTFYRTLFFCPGVDFSGDYLKGNICIPNANLQGANFSRTRFMQANLEGSDLRGTKWNNAILVYKINMRNVDLRGADLREVDLTKADLSGANLEGVDLSRTRMPFDLREISLTSEQVKQIELVSGDMRKHSYRSMGFERLIKELEVSEKEFEYLVLSRVIEVRDNDTGKIVDSNFDPELHHVPFWSVEKVKRAIFASQADSSASTLAAE